MGLNRSGVTRSLWADDMIHELEAIKREARKTKWGNQPRFGRNKSKLTHCREGVHAVRVLRDALSDEGGRAHGGTEKSSGVEIGLIAAQFSGLSP
jgi:hypothetical protein